MTGLTARASRDQISENDTRLRLIDTAERLFAEHGIEAVSLNRITREAEQRNASALQYHFGSKKEFIKAILGRRMEGINRRRLGLLSQMPDDDKDCALRHVAQALVVPLAEQLAHDKGGRNYVRFLAQVYGDPRIDMFDLVRGQHDTSVREITRRVLSLLSTQPPQVARQRLAFVSTLFIHSLAECARTLAHEMREPRESEIETLAALLIDSIVAILGAEPNAVPHTFSTENKPTMALAEG